MPREQKIGMTLLILAVGLGGAFCFRKPQPAASPGLPQLADEAGINQQVAELRTRPLLPGIDLQQSGPAPATREELLLRELAGLQPGHLRPRQGDYAPPPIGQMTEERTALVPPPRETPLPPSQQRLPGSGSSLARPMSRTQPSPVVPDHRSSGEQFHTVQPGETLTGIAWQYYGASSKYTDLYEANRDLLPSPNHLRPGMKLRLPDLNPSASQRDAGFSTPQPEVKEAQREANPAVSVTTPPAGVSEQSTPVDVVAAPSPFPEDQSTPRSRMFVPAHHNPFLQRNTDSSRAAQRPETPDSRVR